MLTGVLVTVGALLLWRIRPSSWLNDTALVVLVIMGLGKILLGFAPENTDVGLHLMGALNVPLGSMAVLLLSLVMRRTDRGLSAIGMERVATYPAPLWLLWTCRTGAVTRDQPPAAPRRRVPAFPGPRIPDPVFAVEGVELQLVGLVVAEVPVRVELSTGEASPVNRQGRACSGNENGGPDLVQ